MNKTFEIWLDYKIYFTDNQVRLGGQKKFSRKGSFEEISKSQIVFECSQLQGGEGRQYNVCIWMFPSNLLKFGAFSLVTKDRSRVSSRQTECSMITIQTNILIHGQRNSKCPFVFHTHLGGKIITRVKEKGLWPISKLKESQIQPLVL